MADRIALAVVYADRILGPLPAGGGLEWAACGDALADMLAVGFVDSADLAVVASVLDEIEEEDDAAGYEDEPEAVVLLRRRLVMEAAA
jgi:hypothetical protein